MRSPRSAGSNKCWAGPPDLNQTSGANGACGVNVLNYPDGGGARVSSHPYAVPAEGRGRDYRVSTAALVPPPVFARLKLLAGNRWNSDGSILITARNFRTQEANREDARRRLAEMIAEAHLVQRKRKPTRPSRAAKAKRIDEKKGRGAIKAARGKVRLD